MLNNLLSYLLATWTTKKRRPSSAAPSCLFWRLRLVQSQVFVPLPPHRSQAGSNRAAKRDAARQLGVRLWQMASLWEEVFPGTGSPPCVPLLAGQRGHVTQRPVLRGPSDGVALSPGAGRGSSEPRARLTALVSLPDGCQCSQLCRHRVAIKWLFKYANPGRKDNV